MIFQHLELSKEILLQLLLLLIFPHVFSDIISSSQIDKCYASTSDNSSSTLMNCNKKVVLSISLDNNELQGSNSITALVTQTTDATNKAINYILKTPIQIKMSKSQVYAMYPLTYVQDFNNKPMENIIGSSLLDCQDGDYDKNPTCGFQYDSNNNKILYSQGYCCECSFLDTIGLDNSHLSRGNICKALNIGQGSASAHCLNMDDLWYSAFNIGTHQTYYSITINVNFLTPGQNNITQNNSIIDGVPYFSSSIRLGSFKNVDFDQNRTVLAKIIGDFYPLQPPVELSNYYLMKPSRPFNDPRVLQGMSRWMFISKELVTLDGSECDKIGVSYEAFQNQANKCSMIIGSCLKNQLEDFNSDDLQRINEGNQPHYLLSSQGNFLASQNQDQISLLLEISCSYPTLLTLEISADDIQYITNLGKGEIDYATITNFEAFSNNGKLNMMVTNTGELTAEFDIYFECDSAINPLSFQKLFINPMESNIFSLDIRTNNNQATNHSCEIFLKDAIGNTLDKKIINFTTTAINYTSSQNSSNNNLTSAISQPIKTNVNCDDICPNFYDFICSFSNSCSENILKFIFFLFFLIVGFSCCCYCCKKHPSCCCSLISWVFKKKQENDKQKSKKTKKSQPKQAKKRSQSLIENSSFSHDDSYSSYDYEAQNRKIKSYEIKKPDCKNNHNIILRNRNQKDVQIPQKQNAEIYCFDHKNQSFYKNNEISNEISDFDASQDMNSKSQILENSEIPEKILKDRSLNKVFINFNKKHECWKCYKFPFNFSIGIYWIYSKNSNSYKDHSLILLPKDSSLKYLVYCFYENQAEIILAEILKVSMENLIFITKRPIYKLLNKEDIDLYLEL